MLLVNHNLRGKKTKEFVISELNNKTGVDLKDDEVRLEEAVNGRSTLLVQTQVGWNYLHSKYDPEGEAARWLNSVENVENYKHVFFYGIGLGYHIKVFREKYPEMVYSIYEPELPILKHYLSLTPMDEIITDNLQFFYTQEEASRDNDIRHFVGNVKDEVLLVILPVYERVFSQKTKEFMERFSEIIFDRRKYNYAALAFSKRTIISGIKNLPALFNTPNILHEDDESFRGKPAVLVAAGPSLDYEFENLRYIKENGLAYIFSVGTAINSLLEKEIYPDGACTYDPSVKNAEVFQKIKEKQVDSVPLIFGSTVGFETLENYPGPLVHYLVNRDFVNPYYLKRTDDTALEVVQSAESIAIVTLQLLYRLGCNPIILVGQNLGYSKDRSYAFGSKDDVGIDEAILKKAYVIKDVEGNDMLTIKGFDSFRKEMESFIHSFQDVEVINTTRGGANIAGTTYIPMETVIRERLKTKNIVDQKWILQHNTRYEKDFFVDQSKILAEERKKMEEVFKTFFKLLDQMKSAIHKTNVREIEKLFNKFDLRFDKLQANNFYLFFIQVMNHLEFDLVMKTFEEVRFLKDPMEKAKKVVEDFSHYLALCRADMQMITPLIDEVYEQVLGTFADGKGVKNGTDK